MPRLPPRFATGIAGRHILINRSWWMGLGSIALVTGLAVAACGNSDDDGSGGGNSCTTPTTSNTDGSTACEPQCGANEHCTTGGVNCLDGCTSTANCGMGEYCDMTAATHDLEGTSTGLCRTPPVCTVTTRDAGATGDTGTGGGTGGGSTQVGACFSGSSPTSQPTSACNAYAQCIDSSCVTQFDTALGPDWQSGTIGGDCKAYFNCLESNGCTQSAEQTCASQSTASCNSDLGAISTCLESACGTELQACTNSVGGDDTGGDTSDASTTSPASCTNLVACCKVITDTFDQMECASIASSNDSSACQSGLNMFEANDDCP